MDDNEEYKEECEWEFGGDHENGTEENMRMYRNSHMWIEKDSRPVIVVACLQRCHMWASLQVLHFNWNMCLNIGIEEKKNFAQWQLFKWMIIISLVSVGIITTSR